MDRMKPLSDAAQALTSLALREDAAAIFTLLKCPGELVALNKTFINIMNEMNVQSKVCQELARYAVISLAGAASFGNNECRHGKRCYISFFLSKLLVLCDRFVPVVLPCVMKGIHAWGKYDTMGPHLSFGSITS